MVFTIKLEEGALKPKRGSDQAAGYDLYANKPDMINPHDRRLISTGLRIAIPEGHYGRIAPRSGLAVKKSVDIGAGVIDSDYRGEVKILVINNGRETFHINKHDRIAQLILEKISLPEITVVEDLDETNRGEGGFGSTGQ